MVRLALGLVVATTLAACSFGAAPPPPPADPAADALARGIAAHNAGRYDEAKQAYYEPLYRDPKNKFAFYNLRQPARISEQFGFDIVKALWSRAIEWPTAAALLLTLYRYGLAVIPRTRLHFLVVGFVVANFLSVLTAENHYISIFGERNRYLGLTNTVDMAV